MASTYSPQVREQSNSFHSGADHPRISICDVCQLSPASVTCKADSASLCSSCDRDIHHANPLASRHHRLPFVPFFDSVSATNASAFILPDDLDTFLEENRIYGADSVVPIQTLKSNDGFQVDFAQSTFDFSPQCFSQSVKQAIEDRGVEEAKEDHSPSPPPANPVKEEKDLDYPPPVENKALALTIVPFGRIGGAIFPIQSHNLLSMLLIQAISTGLQ